MQTKKKGGINPPVLLCPPLFASVFLLHQQHLLAPGLGAHHACGDKQVVADPVDARLVSRHDAGVPRPLSDSSPVPQQHALQPPCHRACDVELCGLNAPTGEDEAAQRREVLFEVLNPPRHLALGTSPAVRAGAVLACFFIGKLVRRADGNFVTPPLARKHKTPSRVQRGSSGVRSGGRGPRVLSPFALCFALSSRRQARLTR